MSDIPPFVSFGNEELSVARPVGEMERCPHCGALHPVEESDPPMIQFVQCPSGKLFMVGVKGKYVGDRFRRGQ